VDRPAIFFMLFSTLTLSGCFNLAPVRDVRDSPIAVPRNVERSEAVVRDGIVRGLTAKGWSIEGESGPTLIASVTGGGHWAKVRIDYTAHAFSITYQDSSPGLRYDGESVHRRYNHWVHLLERAIRKQLANARPDAAPPADTTAPPPAPAADAVPPPPPTAEAVPAPPPATGAPQ